MAMQRAIFLDRDKTIIDNVEESADPNKIILIQGAANAIASLRGLGFRIIVATNQDGVAKGKFSEQDVDKVHQRVAQLMLKKATGAIIDRFYYCPFHPDAVLKKYKGDHTWRKPQPGMLLQAGKDLNIDMHMSWMVGDSISDIEAGYRAGCRTVLIGSKKDFPKDNEIKPNFFARNLIEAARIVAQHPRREKKVAPAPSMNVGSSIISSMRGKSETKADAPIVRAMPKPLPAAESQHPASQDAGVAVAEKTTEQAVAEAVKEAEAVTEKNDNGGNDGDGMQVTVKVSEPAKPSNRGGDSTPPANDGKGDEGPSLFEEVPEGDKSAEKAEVKPKVEAKVEPAKKASETKQVIEAAKPVIKQSRSEAPVAAGKPVIKEKVEAKPVVEAKTENKEAVVSSTKKEAVEEPPVTRVQPKVYTKPVIARTNTETGEKGSIAESTQNKMLQTVLREVRSIKQTQGEQARQIDSLIADQSKLQDMASVSPAATEEAEGKVDHSMSKLVIGIVEILAVFFLGLAIIKGGSDLLTFVKFISGAGFCQLIVITILAWKPKW